jgi:hypothetical protein
VLRSKFFTWCGSSLIGHVALFEIGFSIAMGILAVLVNYAEGTLTLAWAWHIVLVSAVGGAAMAVVIRYAVTLPFLKRHGDGS